MASSSTNVATDDVYDIECVPRYTDFTSPNLDHDETIGDKWFELQECQQSTPVDEVSPVLPELPSLAAEEERPVVQELQTSTIDKKRSVVEQQASSSTKKRPLTQGAQASATPDHKNPVHRTVIPQPIKFATDERIKRRSQSRDAVRTVTPATPKPFMQGLRQYDKPTGSPARKPLTQPNPFHFHEVKHREKKVESQQPVIKNKPPVPQHTVKPPPTKPLRAVVPLIASTGASPKQVPIVGRPPRERRAIRRSASASNVRTGEVPPPADNEVTSGRCSLVVSTSSANKENMEQGATHGLQVSSKDRGRCRERAQRSLLGKVPAPNTTPVDQRPKPFMQGLRQYDKPTGSPALKPLTQPNPFHFHEIKQREKKAEPQQPVIKSKPPVPQNAAKPPPMKPMRATARPSVDGAAKQLPITGRPPSGQRFVIRRSVSARNVRSGEVLPPAANSDMVNGVISGRSSLAGSTTSLNILEQGATHGLHVAVKDRSRSRGRQRGGRR